MLTQNLKQAADELAAAIQSLQATKEYLEALNRYENDFELKNLKEKYYYLSEEFLRKQYEGSLTQSEIIELKQLASKINNNPLTKKLIEKENELKMILQDVNNIISDEISMDFARLAAPSNC